MQCKNCQRYIKAWCDRKQDSPDPDLERDCDQFVDRFAAIIDFLGEDYYLDRLREQVEKVWRGEWKCHGDCGVTECSACGWNIEEYVGNYNFCPVCGAPMTDEAVDMVMERLEALKDGKGD